MGHANASTRFSWLMLVASILLSESAIAQDLEPRRWSHMPTGLYIVGLGYAYTEADLYFNPVWKITDGNARLNNVGFRAIRTFDVAGKSARVDLVLPYTSGRYSGDVDNE